MWCTTGIIQFQGSFDFITVFADVLFDQLMDIKVGISGVAIAILEHDVQF